ncbi:MAG: SDR family oxidoreductase [Thermoguttaceae bacterium]
MTKLIVGCGYLGGRVARLWRAEGHAVVAVSRHAEKGDCPLLCEAPEGPFRQMGTVPFFLADVTRPETLAGLPAAETVLFAVGYDPRGGHSRREVYIDGLRNVLAALPPGTGRFILISSTGVYGDAGGEWVDEQSPCHPTHEAGRALLAAEEVLRRHPLGSQGIILRLAGLYGPGRLPLAGLSSAEPLAVAADNLVNLIHVDDAAAVVLAAERRAQPPRTYLVADGRPVPRREYLSYLAELAGLAAPRFREPTAAAPPRRGGPKRVGNARMLAELGVVLAYPSYREGLAASVGR